MNRPETARISHRDEAGTYLGITDAKHIIYVTDGIGSPTDMSTGHGEIPSIKSDALTTENKTETAANEMVNVRKH